MCQEAAPTTVITNKQGHEEQTLNSGWAANSSSNSATSLGYRGKTTHLRSF